MANNSDEILPVSIPIKFPEIHEPTFVGVPVRLSSTLGPSLYNVLSKDERDGIVEAAKTIYQNYITAIENLE
jgi:hypothetical protein